MITLRWNQRSRWGGNPDHHEAEYAVGVRKRLGQYFASVTRSDTLRARWQAYLTLVEQEFVQTQDALKNAKLDVQKTLTSTLSAGSTSTGPANLVLDRKIAEVDALTAALQPRAAPRSVGCAFASLFPHPE